MLLGRAEDLDTLAISQVSISISQLLKRIHPAGGDDERTSPVNGGQALDRKLLGTMVHRMLELWDFTASEAPPVEQIVSAESPAIHTRAQYEAELNEAVTRVEESDFFAQLQQAVGIQKELPFLFRVDDTGISGTIDARLPDGTIVDYKTGSRRPESHRRYETQLRLYAAALQAIEGRAPSKGVLFYVDSGETYEVDLSESLIEEGVDDARKALRAGIA